MTQQPASAEGNSEEGLHFRHTTLWMRITNSSPCWRLRSTSWKGKYLLYCFEFFHMEDLSFSSHLCIYSFIYIRMDSWVFLLYFGKLNLFQLWTLEVLSNSLLHLIFRIPSFCFLSNPLLSVTTRGSKLIMYISWPALESAISRRSPI